MLDKSEALLAIDSLSGFDLHGSNLTVEVSVYRHLFKGNYIA